MTIQIDETQTFLTVKDAKQIINSIVELKDSVNEQQVDTKKILEVVTDINRLFNPKIDGEKGVMVQISSLKGDMDFLKKFVYAGIGIYGFLLFCFTVWSVIK